MARVRVAFLGPTGSFSHEAALQLYGPSAENVPCVSFGEAFSAVQRKTAHYAVIPFENSTNGSVVQTLDLLADHDNLYSDIVVFDEHYLAVHHCLLAKNAFQQQPSAKPHDYRSITKLYTHPQAWGQCEEFLSRYFKGVERQDVSSTSKAAEIISMDATGQSAAIASRFAADHYGASVLESNIEDRHDNTTRFLVLRNLESLRTDGAGLPETDNKIEISPPVWKQKALISFTINHSSPGAFADALLTFKSHGMNLTSINSRPSLVRAWQYIFFVECEAISRAHFDDVVEKMLNGLGDVTESCRNLGSWRDRLLAK